MSLFLEDSQAAFSFCGSIESLDKADSISPRMIVNGCLQLMRSFAGKIGLPGPKLRSKRSKVLFSTDTRRSISFVRRRIRLYGVRQRFVREFAPAASRYILQWLERFPGRPPKRRKAATMTAKGQRK